MAGKILEGKKIAEKIREQIQEEVMTLKQKTGKTPGLAVILVGENPASKVYVNMKQVACGKTGIHSKKIHLPESISEEELLQQVKELNEDESIHGILVQLPLPKHISEERILESVKAEKDVDGFHPLNFGKLLAGHPFLVPATPLGVMKLIESTGVSLEGKEAVVIGRSNIVGKPCAILLQIKDCTVTLCHSKTRDLKKHCLNADVMVSAVGKPKLVKKDFVKQGAVVIDVGITKVEDKLEGDVDFEEVKEVAGWITPVPGGVGPMTIAMLLSNTLKVFKQIEGLQ